MTLESADALAPRSSTRDETRRSGQLPHLDGLVQTSTDQTISRRSKSNTVNAVLVALLSLKTNDKATRVDVPDSDALVQGTGRDIATIRRDRNSSNAILDGQVEHLLIRFKIPEANTPVAASRCNDTTVLGKVQRVDILLVASELVLDSAGRNVPDANDLILGASREILTVGTEADTANVQVAVFRETSVLEKGNGRSGFDIENLSRTVAASGHIATVSAEPHAADYALVRQVVDQLNVQHAPGAGVEDGEPIRLLLLEVRWQRLQIEISQDIALTERNSWWTERMLLVWRGSRAGYLRRSGVGCRTVLLRSRRTRRSTGTRARALAPRRGRRLGWLTVACASVSLSSSLISTCWQHSPPFIEGAEP